MSAEDREVLVRYNVCGLVGVLLSFCGRPDLDQARLAAQLEKVLNGEMREWGGAKTAQRRGGGPRRWALRPPFFVHSPR